VVEERTLRHLVELAVVEEEGNIEHGLAVFQERKTEGGRIAAGLEKYSQRW
jgi:hypothetical protein